MAKVNAAGTALVYCGYIGGSGDDDGYGIAVDSAGNAYVTGYTSSTEATFPVTVGPDLTYNGGDCDAFVAKVNAAGTALVYCGYIGGSGDDLWLRHRRGRRGQRLCHGIHQLHRGHLSRDRRAGPDLQRRRHDAFVAKVNAAGTALVYCGYIGGSGDDRGYGIAVDSAGNAYVTGSTDSDRGHLPGDRRAGPDLQRRHCDAFVAKVNAAGTALVYCGYIGGSGRDDGCGIAVDSSGNAYVTGYTDSDRGHLPGDRRAGPDLQRRLSDAFVAKVNAAGTALVYCGYIGGSGDDDGCGIAVDGSGNAYVTGYTASTEATFPVTVGPDLTFNGGEDAFVAKITQGRSYFTVTPCRVIDTRGPAGPYGGPSLDAGADRTFVFGGQCAISESATAVSLNVVAVLPTDGPGFLTLFPGGTPRPLASTMNYNPGKTRANNAVIPLGLLKDITVHCQQGTGTTDMVIDVTGYFEY